MTEPAPIHTKRPQLIAITKGGAFILLGGVITHGITHFVGNPTSSALLSAAAMSLVASRIGLTRDEQASVTTPRPSVRFGALALSPLALLLLLGLVIDSLALATGSLGFGLAVSSAESLSIAYRNEVWLHGGVLLYAYRAGVRPMWAVLYAAAASGAAVASLPETTLAGAALVIASSSWFATLWQRHGDARWPLLAHGLWAWTATTVLGGEPLDASLAGASLPYGPQAQGWPAWLLSVLYVGLTLRSWKHLDREWTAWRES